jgi:hypothetical protein
MVNFWNYSRYSLYFICCLSSVFFLFNPAKFPADDGFFYPQIAFNIVHEKGSYFNDLYLTNGYHPLWMVFCVLAELINPLAKQDVVYILWAFQILFFVLSINLITPFFKNNFQRYIFIIVLSIAFLGIGTFYLTEAHLNLLSLCLILNFIQRQKKNDFLFGFLCSILFLARLDNIFIIIPLGVYYWHFKNWKVLSLLNILCGFTLLVLPYIISNLYFFESIVPISGRIKSTFPYIKSEIILGLWQKIFLLSILAYYVLIIISKNINYKTQKLYFLTGSFLLLLYNILFQSEVMQWYFVSQMLVLGFFLYDIFDRIKTNIPSYIKIGICVFLFLFSMIIPALKMGGNFSFEKFFFLNSQELSFYSQEPIKTATGKISKITDSGSRVFVYDFPGKYAFYSDRNFIPADGLVGNESFFNEISGSTFQSYMLKNKIDYLIVPSYFNSRKGTFSFVGMDVSGYKNDLKYFVKNSKTKKRVSEIDLNNFEQIATFENPSKFWQNNYDSIKVFKIIK